MLCSKISACLILTFFLSALSTNLFSQELRENENGEKIIVFPDGSWQYFSEFKGEDKKINARQDRQASFPVFDGEIEPLEGAISVSVQDLQKIAFRKLQLTREAHEIANVRANEALAQRQKLEKEFQKAKNDPNINQHTLHYLKLKLEAAVKTEKATFTELDLVQSRIKEAELFTEKGNFVAAFKESQKDKKSNSYLNDQASVIAEKSYQELIPLGDYYGQSINKNTSIFPPEASCSFAFEGSDEKSGQWRRDVTQSLLFTHTDDQLRVFLKDKAYLRCEGFLSAIGGFRFLTLEFTFAYPNAREAYGFIEKGSILTILLLNGDFINLQAGQMDRGSYNTKREELKYRINYPIDRGQLAVLKESEVDKIRVFWSSGFEEYPVYQMDFFINQLDCLEE